MFRSKSSKYACLLLIASLVGLSLSLAGCHRWHSGGSNGNNQGRGTDGNQQETSPEAYVLSLFKGEETTAADAKKIISTLPALNWSVYDKQSNGGAMKLLTWLYDREFDEVADITSVLKATTGLDGALTNQYANVVGKLCSNRLTEFIDALSTLSNEQADKICDFLGYYSTEADVSFIKHHLDTLMKSSEVTGAQKAVIEKLIKTFK